MENELLKLALQATGKSEEDFNKEVEKVKGNSSVEVMGNLMAIMMESMDATANMLSLIMMQNASLEAEITALKGGKTNA